MFAGSQYDPIFVFKKLLYSDDSLIQTRLFPVDISGLTSFPDYRIAHQSRNGNRFPHLNTNERGLEYFIPTKFGEYPSSDSVVKSDYVFQYIYMH